VWSGVSLGAGLSAGAVSSDGLGPLTVLPFALDARQSTFLVFWPLLYLRLEAIQGWAFELGTGSRYQPTDGIFVGFRFGFDRPGSVAGRIGVEYTFLTEPPRFFAGLAFPVWAGFRAELRAQGLPFACFDVLSSCDLYLSGTLRLSHDF
jgi:hypothetical protein